MHALLSIPCMQSYYMQYIFNTAFTAGRQATNLALSRFLLLLDGQKAFPERNVYEKQMTDENMALFMGKAYSVSLT